VSAGWPADWPALRAVVAARVREGRARRGLRLAALARFTGVPLEALAGIESNQAANVEDVAWLRRIAAVLRVAMGDLVAEPGQSPLDTHRPYTVPPDEPAMAGPAMAGAGIAGAGIAGDGPGSEGGDRRG
jgi:hypothetical protein